jgi:N-acetylated-alpha-linked acidic dipeptidase
MIALMTILLALVLALAPQDAAPPSRALSMDLCSAPRLAGTAGSERAARWVAAKLTAAGWDTGIETRGVLLSLPKSIDFSATVGDVELFRRRDRFDANAVPPGDVPLYHAWAKSGSAEGLVVDVGGGLRADFDALVAAGVDLEGTVALARYGGAYRGVKVALATEYGCSACLIFSSSDEDGPQRGETWPKGPWKPGYDAQRGSILSLTTAPGDPSTPGFASPLWNIEGAALPGGNEAPDTPPLVGADLEERLPQIPSLPIGASHAGAIIERIQAGEQVTVRLSLEMQVERRALFNVVGSLKPTPDWSGDFVIAGTHRDAWVRGAQDSGSGVVSLVRAAQTMGALYQSGWRPQNEIRVAFWDGEESGLMGSTEWGEAHADEIRTHCLAYVNGDACVSGTDFRISGTPGLEGAIERALAQIASPNTAEATMAEDWFASANDGKPHLGLPGSGSDYTVFLHHLGIPILDFGFGGNAGGQYHTAFDDFAQMDRFLDPTWLGHEKAGEVFAGLLSAIADAGRGSMDAALAVRELSRAMSLSGSSALDLLALSAADGALGEDAPLIYQRLAAPEGLPGRPWYRNLLWAPGQETGYAAVLLPTLSDGASAIVDTILASKEAEERP